MLSRSATLGRVLWLALVLAVAVTLPARADTPTIGTHVRLQAWTIEAGWHEGKVVRSADGCTIVELQAPDAEGHASITLARIDWLEVRRGDSWSTVSVGRLLEREPAECRGPGT